MSTVEQKKSVKSVVLEAYGGYDKLKVQDWPLDELGDNDVRVRVELCGNNFSDIYTRQGFLRQLTTPRVLGTECFGTVESIGNDVKNFQCGDRVVCYVWTGGLFRETVVVPAINCFSVPASVSGRDAVALPANYLTAYMSIFTMGNLRPRDTILVHSAGGGVGCAIAQLAKTVDNVTVVGTASAFKHEKIREIGVHHTLLHENYVEQARAVCPKGFDLIVDSKGGPNIELSQKLLKPCGRLVIIGASTYINGDTLNTLKAMSVKWRTKSIDPEKIIQRNICVSGLHLGELFDSDANKIHDVMHKLFDMIENGQIKPVIFDTVHFDRVVEAQQILAERKNIGKVLLTLSQT
ncbi:synaptic vesicle membrane protein VAT-1 homolog isoform X2 [Adelges cooleyi]|nr:synaptic vesicle membrane protein VAT-1 homolog isoform X2 [Adelges cooleyi]